jgi:phosphorylase kinase alpha/beta subunit
MSADNSALESNRKAWRLRLEQRFDEIDALILSRQDPITGLLPASTAKLAHGDYTDAWVRDNVYSVLTVWGLALAYRRFDDTHPHTYLLSQSVVKLMRGLLVAMMQQADKVERFKFSLQPADALHAKYDTRSGTAVVGDEDWGHLQLDSTSLYLLMLAQITASGINIVYSLDEVNFVQNLVHYISRAYCTPDYGIWERGNKINRGLTELNASSVGMAKAALEGLSGFNLFGANGAQPSCIHVNPDDIARARDTLQALLPRESGSKEVDAALLSIIGFPAFAIEDLSLVEQTQQEIINKLQGRYGCKRFLLDGHQTVHEDPSRLHYEPGELKQFEHIECEWPLFFTYLLINAIFHDDEAQIKTYSDALKPLLVEQNGQHLLPELYFVAEEHIEQEKAAPHSQPRQPNENIPLVWAQSLYQLAGLLQDGLLHVYEIDPLRRRQRVGRVRSRKIQIAVLAQNDMVQSHLESRRVAVETLDEVRPIQVRQAEELTLAYTRLGMNYKLRLSGRPLHPMRTLSTARVFELAGERMVFVPIFLNPQDFYLSMDNRLLVEQLSIELAYLERHWDQPGKPLVVMVISENMITEEGSQTLLELMGQLQEGNFNDIPVQTGRLAQLLATTGRERIDYLHDFSFTAPTLQDQKPHDWLLSFDPKTTILPRPQLIDQHELDPDSTALVAQLFDTDNVYEQLELLRILSERHTLQHQVQSKRTNGTKVNIETLIEQIYQGAGEHHLWAIVRRAADLLGKHDVRLEDAVTDIVIRQKRLSVGHAYSDDAIIVQPVENSEILAKIHNFCGGNVAEATLTQEIVLYLGQLIKGQPGLFTDMLTLRVWHLIQLMIGQISSDEHVSPSLAYERLLALPPYRVLEKLRNVLSSYSSVVSDLTHSETLHTTRSYGELVKVHFPIAPEIPENAENWLKWRTQRGMITRLSDDFYAGVWEILQHCEGVMIGDKFNRYNRLGNELAKQSTRGEKNFALLVDHVINRITAPEYRRLTIEALSAIIAFIRANAELQIDNELVMDVLIGHAVRLTWEKARPDATSHYNEYRAQAWKHFYHQPPHEVASAILRAFVFLMQSDNGNKNVPTPETSAGERLDLDGLI